MKKKLVVPAALVTLLGMDACKAPVSEQVKTEDMNILLIGIEDWSAFTVGCYGNNIVKTPHVDGLAAKGIRFDRAYCAAPVCNPSRTALVTGVRPDKNRIFGNPAHMDEHVPEGLPFMPSTLKKRGDVHTAHLGKIVHKWYEATRFINEFDQVEFEKPYAMPNGRIEETEPDHMAYFKGQKKYTNVIPDLISAIPDRDWVHVPDREADGLLESKRITRDSILASGTPTSWTIRKPFQQLHSEQVGNCGFKEEHHEDGILARVTAQMIGDYAKEKKQFFLSVGLYAPHTPNLAPKKYVDMYDPGKMELTPATRDKDNGVPNIAIRKGNNYDVFNGMYPQYAPTEERQKEVIAAYYACASYVDAQVGIILDALEKNGLSENTIVVLFGDHGFHLGEHGCWSKFTLFEQSTRIPMVAYVPGAAGNGKSCDEIVEMVDIFPTFCELWNVKKPEVLEGISFKKLLEFPETPWKKAAFTVCPKPLNGRSVRTKQYKYAEYLSREDALPGSEKPKDAELYDLYADPYEQNNLINDPAHATVVAELKQMLVKGWSSALPESQLN